MATFNYAAAVAAGKSPDEINNFLTSHPELQVVGGPNVSASTQTSQPQVQNQPQIDQTQSPSLGGFLGNVGSDIGGIVGGLANLPSAVAKLTPIQGLLDLIQGKQPDIMQPAKTAVGILGNYAQSLNKDIGQPLEGGNVLGRAGQNLYQRPVSTLLDVLPFLQGAKALQAGKVAETAGEAGNVAKGIEDVSRAQADLFSSNFTLPAKMAARINPVDTAKQLIADGISGNYGKLADVSNNVISKTSKFIRDMLPADSSVDVGNAVDSAKNILTREAPEANTNTYVKNINDIINPKGGSPNTLDALQSARDLETRGYKYINSAKDISGNIDPVKEGIGNSYLAAADEITSKIEGKLQQFPINPDLKAQLVSDLKEISPNLAKRAEGIQTLADARSLMSPYVRLKQMATVAGNSANTPASKIADLATKTVVGGTGLATGGPLGALLGLVASPTIESGISSILPSVLTKTAQLNIPGALGNILRGAGNVGMGATQLGRLSGQVSPGPLGRPGNINAVGQSPISPDQNANNKENNQGAPIVSQTGANVNLQPHSFMDYIDVIQNRKPGSTISPADVAAKTANMAPPLAENVRQAYTQRLGTSAQQAEAQARADADRVVTNLQNIYNQSDIAGQPGLAGFTGPIANFLAGKIAGSNPTLRAYNAARDAAALSLVSAYADKGIRSSVPSYEKAIELLPSASDSPKDAQAKFDQLRTTLGLIK